MSKFLRPRRGKRTTAINKNIVLKEGEIFFEIPNTGSGTGEGKIYMGDGTTSYENLPAYIDLSKKANQPITITYDQYLAMPEQERDAGDWIIPDYPGVEGAGTLSGLEDVALNSPTNGQALMYDNTNHVWINGTIPSPDGKADKVSGATAGDLATLDGNGNLTDSSIKSSNVVTADSTTHVLSGTLIANATATADLTTKQVRNIYCGTTDLTPGVSVLPAGDIYIYYEQT